MQDRRPGYPKLPTAGHAGKVLRDTSLRAIESFLNTSDSAARFSFDFGLSALCFTRFLDRLNARFHIGLRSRLSLRLHDRIRQIGGRTLDGAGNVMKRILPSPFPPKKNPSPSTSDAFTDFDAYRLHLTGAVHAKFQRRRRPSPSPFRD